MNDHHAFIRAIRAAPDDCTVCLVYADWLEEQGEDLAAELIRVQWELDALPKRKTSIRNVFFNENIPEDFNLDPYRDYRQDPHVNALRRREEILVKRMWNDRAMGFPQVKGLEWGGFERGLVREATVRDFGSFPSIAADLLACMPLETLRIRGERSALEAATLVRLPLMEEIRTLDLEGCRLRVEGMRALIEVPNFPRLRSLILPLNFLGNGGIAALAEARVFPELRKLFVAYNFCGDVGFQALLDSETLADLTLLDARNNDSGGRIQDALIKKFGDRILL